jgi:ATP-binding cassette subfamily B multidrug efflux pump
MRSDPAVSPRRRAAALLLRAATGERRHIWIGIPCLALAAGLEMLGPLLGKRLIDHHVLPRELDWPAILLLLGAILVSGCVATVLRYVQLVRLAGVAMRSVRRLRELVYGHVLALPMTYFDRAITGQLVSRVTNDTEAVRTLYVQVLFVLIDNGIVVLGAMAAMAWLDWRLMLLVLAAVPLVIGIVFLYQRWSAPAVAKARQLRSDINAQIAESIGGMSVLQAANATRRYGERFGATNRGHYTARLAELRANAFLLRPALDLLNVFLLAVVLYSFGRRPLSGTEVGVLYAFVSFIGRGVEALIQITIQFGQIQQSMIAAARVDALLQEERPDTRAEAGYDHVTPRTGAAPVALDRIGFGYKDGEPVLHDLSLAIPAGAFYGIVGHTGSGKSTLLSLLLRFYAPQQGAITIDGVPLASVGNAAFRNDVALVPQDPFLLAGDAFENIDMGRGLPPHEIEAAARAAHAHEFITALEQGYRTPLGEGGSRLSTGQKQLVAIARALAGKPRILLLDEATSHIDSETEQIVQAALTELHGTVTVIAIAHRLSTIRDADSIVVLNHGRIAEQGTHDALMAIDGGIYQRLYLLQQLAD